MKRILIIAAAVMTVAAPPAAAQDDPIMQTYEAGDGPNARNMWELMASTGDYEAQVILGWLYSGKMDPKGVRVDLEDARYWMGQAVAQRDVAIADGLDAALYEFAGALHAGKMDKTFGKVGADEVVEWFILAAKLGHAKAGFAVGMLYKSGGDGLAPDLALAEKWFEWAAPASPNALLQAATLHFEQGRLDRAFYWLDHAYLLNARGIENVYGRDPFADGNGMNFPVMMNAMLDAVAGKLFPEPLPRWESRGYEHEMHAQSEGDAVVTRNGDGIRYPVEMEAAYADSATGTGVLLMVRLNYVREADGFRGVVKTYEQYDDAKRRELRDRGLHVADVGGYQAFSIPGEDISYQTVLPNDILVYSGITASSGDAETDRTIALDYLRAFDFEKIVEGTRGHGVFGVDENGEVVKP
ncbi:MAG: tetratricopeptide repeat protein [Parvularculaceae bacterium]